jgi:aryl carrier-like protein
VGVTALSAPALADDAERPGFDTLYGNGGVLYGLSHGGVTPATLSVRVGGRPLKLGQDFFFNSDSGTLSFAEPVNAGASIHVRYHYNPSADKAGNPFRFSYVPGFAGNLNVSLLYSTTPGSMNFGSSGSQVTGFTLDPKPLGFANFSGMMLLSQKGGGPLDALRRARDGRSSLVSQLIGKGKDAGPKQDELYQYGLDNIKVGKGTFGVSYRKVGKDFDFSPVASQFQDGPKKALFDRLQKEKGLSTLGFNGNYGFGKSALSNLGYTQVSDEKGKATQQTLGLTSKTFDLSYNSLKVDSGFTHLKEADLKDVGDLKPGQERSNLVANLRPSKSLSLQSTITKLKQANGDSQSVTKQALEFKPGKNTRISYAQQQAINRLAQGSDNTKKELRQSLALNHQTKGGIVLQAAQDTLQAAQGDKKAIQRSTLFHIESDPKKTTVFLFEKKLDRDLAGVEKNAHKMSFSTRMAKLATVQWSDNALEIREKENLKTIYDRKLKIETDAKKPISLLVDNQSSRTEDGASKAIQQIVFNAQVSPNLTLKDTDFDQSNNDHSVSGNNLEITAKPAPKVEITGNVMNREETDKGGTDELNLNLKAQTGDMEIAAAHHEDEVEKENIAGKENGLTLATAVGDNAKLKGNYFTRKNKAGVTEKLLKSLGLERGAFGGRFLCELGTTSYVQGHPFTTYAAGFTSNQNEKLPLRFTTLYRKLSARDGSELSEYQYSLDYKVSSRFSFSAKSFQNNSVRDGYFYNITAVRGNGFSFDAALSPQLKLSAGFSNEEDLNSHKLIHAKNLSLKGNLDAKTLIDFLYQSFIADKWKEDTPTHWLRLSIKREVNDEDSLVLTGEAKFWDDSDPSTKDKRFANGRLDFVRAF